MSSQRKTVALVKALEHLWAPHVVEDTSSALHKFHLAFIFPEPCHPATHPAVGNGAWRPLTYSPGLNPSLTAFFKPNPVRACLPLLLILLFEILIEQVC